MSADVSVAVEHRLSGFDIFYAPEDAARRWLEDRSVLAVIHFGPHTDIDHDDPRHISVGLPPLDGRRCVEVWRTRGKASTERHGDFVIASDDEMLFGAVIVDEHGCGLELGARDGYRRVLELARTLGFPHLVRIWNYFPDINIESDGLERYRAFCVGRYEAFAERGFDENRLAAASAIGTRAPGLLIYFIAAREAGTPIENPRQVSAYRYPRRYAPRHPLFSRAMLKRWRHGTHLYVSGTASVVGHRTVHVGDTLEQLRESARNLDSIVERVRSLDALALRSSRDLKHAKIYLRREEDLGAVEAELDRTFGPDVPRVCLRADICRADLRLEIDAFYSEETN